MAKKTQQAAAEPAAKAPITKKAALEFLRGVEKEIYSKKREKAVLDLADDVKTMEFIGARLAFTALIGRLNRELMEDIGADLQAQAPALRKGIANTLKSLEKLENASKWAKAINTVTSSIGKVVGFF